ncbi:MAG TPA: peptide-methionine (R)-S-oxide reductase MsrB [Isosphaeraceae bacterium]|nr:peptide-methionine (R)-S-oxide reductase MsrB [Isosphaeraceae bacterium]
MMRHRLLHWAWASSATFVVLAVTLTMAAAQDPFQVAEKAGAQSSTRSDGPTASKKGEPEFVRKTEEEWQRVLSQAEYMVTRLKATEPAFTGKYATGHYRGIFTCVCCGAPLFDARTKFESGTGWPSFYQPVNRRAIATAWDTSEAEPRVEVMCRRCGAHLGHVFEDGPPPTGLRYCINSVALRLKQPGDDGSAAIQAVVGGLYAAAVRIQARTPTSRAARTPAAVRRRTDRGRQKGQP